MEDKLNEPYHVIFRQDLNSWNEVNELDHQNLTDEIVYFNYKDILYNSKKTVNRSTTFDISKKWISGYI